MTELSYWDINRRGVIIPHLGIIMNISFMSKYKLEMGLGITYLGKLKNPVKYNIELVISDKSFKYITKKRVLSELEKLIQENKFLAWHLTTGDPEKDESIIYQLFDYPEKIKTDTLNIKDSTINELINKKFKKSQFY